MTLIILLLIIPVIGSIAGLIGKSWDDSKPGKIKFTKRGWTSLVIILIGFISIAVNTIKTHNEYSILKDQRSKVQRLVYTKIFDNCLSLIQPLETLYLEQTNKSTSFDIDVQQKLCLEMMSDSGMRVFRDCDVFQKPESGKAFDSWDSSYANYITGYYNTTYPYEIDQTFSSWTNYIDMDDLILIDSIIHHDYRYMLKDLNYGNTEKEREDYRKEVRYFYFFDNDDNG
jgi:hypothetical protein